MDEWETPLLGESAKELVRAGALRVLLQVPYVLATPLLDHCILTYPGISERPPRASRVQAATSSTSLGSIASPSTIPHSEESTQDHSSANTDEAASTIDDEDSGPNPAKRRRSEAAKGPRAARQTKWDRKAALRADKRVRTVAAHRICCNGCGKWIALHKKREYDHTNWKQHCTKCPSLTGVAYQRIPVAASKKTNVPVSCLRVFCMIANTDCLSSDHWAVAFDFLSGTGPTARICHGPPR